MNDAYSPEIAGESIHDDLRLKWNMQSQSFDGVTHDDLEYFARLIAYKVAANLRNGSIMNELLDPLEYVDCGIS